DLVTGVQTCALPIYHRHAASEWQAERALRALDGNRLRRNGRGHALRQFDRSVRNSGHDQVFLIYATMHSTSPPCPIERACLSVRSEERRVGKGLNYG